MDRFTDATAAVVGTAVSKVATYPLDIIKTVLAAGEGGQSWSSVVHKLTKERGILGLYKGLENKLLKSCTGKFLYFYIYRALMEWQSTGKAAPVSIVANLVIGALSELLELPVVMPLEAVVSKVQTSSDLNGLAAAKLMYREGGVSRFFVAPGAYVLGTLQPAIQNTVFDQAKAALISRRTVTPGSGRLGSSRAQLSALEAFILGAIANAIATTATYPMEVVRMVLQSHGKVVTQSKSETVNGDAHDTANTNGLLGVMREIVREDGPVGLFKGLAPQLLASVLSTALMLMVKDRITHSVRVFLLFMFRKNRRKSTG